MKRSLPSDDTYKAILDGIAEGVYAMDREGSIIYWNPACETLTGYRPDEAIGRCCSDDMLRHVDSAGRELCADGCPMKATLADGRCRRTEVYVRHREGHRIPVQVQTQPVRAHGGRVIAAVQSFSSIADKIAALEQVKQLQQLVYLDPLTGIANRRFLEDTLEARMDEARRYGWMVGVLMIDIDHFKLINDTYGHEVGDAVLCMVARTLQGATRSFDLVGRWGGEEFLAILARTSEEDLALIAERYRALVDTSAVIADGKRLRVTVSVGATAARLDCLETPASLLTRADDLMYESKRKGRNGVSLERLAASTPRA